MRNVKITSVLGAVAVALTLSYPSAAQAQYSPVSVSCGSGRTAVVHQRNGSTHVDCVASGRSARVQRSSIEAPRKRTWQKGALVIGGSAATGAGVGALVGGKKGALIGAALGGGSASIYEATRRR